VRAEPTIGTAAGGKQLAHLEAFEPPTPSSEHWHEVYSPLFAVIRTCSLSAHASQKSVGAVADTHAVIWYLYDDPRLSESARTLIQEVAQAGDQIRFSAITLAEIV
jgi:hypothetical protein